MPAKVSKGKVARISWNSYKAIYDYALEHNISFLEASERLFEKVAESIFEEAERKRKEAEKTEFVTKEKPKSLSEEEAERKRKRAKLRDLYQQRKKLEEEQKKKAGQRSIKEIEEYAKQ
ncbi:MAG: hypothetical protein J7J44_00165, partial [Deltaproteobacteria bacterium]|nr:hypothetical protein [Deltaproteobacteria bacterium]